jgi:hypothetical protein
MINFVQAYYDGRDGKSECTHAAIVWSAESIFETTSWRTGFDHISKYDGSEIEVWRYNPLAGGRAAHWKKAREAALQVIAEQSGRVFPYWRWLLFLGHVASKVHGKSMTCSETVARFLYLCDLLPSFWGWDVDQLHDWFTVHQGWQMIYTGKGRDRV